ncbi:MAG: hypothetical protein NTV62_03550 [Candidatus Gribaldobacteria bacterium]|nr:hypothetical protein [Candidatus Gribaldobacteria bacterium]
MFFISFWQQHKKQGFLLLGLLFLAIILIPLQFAKAAFLTNALLALPNLFISILLQITLLVSQGIIQFGNWFLQIASRGLFNVSLTNPSNNAVISIGWTLVRDMTNILFIVGLAYIGLATALNLSNFTTQKHFLKLLVVALLINFSPIICGVVVDVANILASFFLQSIDFSSITDLFSTQRSLLLTHTMDIITSPTVLLQAVMLIFFGVVSGGILILFGALFFVRAPILWILVILSPLAFFFWAFDKYKKHFDTWMNQFSQWAFIVVPSSFFIYLAQHAILMSKDMLKSEALGEDPTGGVFRSIAPFLVAILFLIFGLMMALKTNAMGASAVTGAFKNTSKKIGKFTAKQAGRGAKAGVKHSAKKVRDKLQQGAPPLANDADYADKLNDDETVKQIGKYNAWKRDHRFRAGARRIGQFIGGGETETEKQQAGWDQGTKKATRTLLRGALNVGTLGLASLAGYGVKKARHITSNAMQQSTHEDIQKSTEKAKKLAGADERVNYIRDGVMADTKIGGLVAMAQNKEGAIVRESIDEKNIVNIIKSAIEKGDSDSISVLKSSFGDLYIKAIEGFERDTTKEEKTQANAETTRIKTEIEAERKVAEGEITTFEKAITDLTNNITGAEAALSVAKKDLGQQNALLNHTEYAKYQQEKVRGATLTGKIGFTVDSQLVAEFDKAEKARTVANTAINTHEATISTNKKQLLEETEKLTAQKEVVEKKDTEIASVDASHNDEKTSTLSRKKLEQSYDYIDEADRRTRGNLHKLNDDRTKGELIGIRMAKILAETLTSNMDNWTKVQATKAIQTEVANSLWTGQQLAKALEISGKKGIEALKLSIEAFTGTQDPAKQEAIYRRRNMPLYNYLKSTAARTLGISFGIEQTNTLLSSLNSRLDDIAKKLNPPPLSPGATPPPPLTQTDIANLTKQQEIILEEIKKQKK